MKKQLLSRWVILATLDLLTQQSIVVHAQEDQLQLAAHQFPAQNFWEKYRKKPLCREISERSKRSLKSVQWNKIGKKENSRLFEHKAYLITGNHVYLLFCFEFCQKSRTLLELCSLPNSLLLGSWSAETSWKAEKSGEIAAAVLLISQI